MLNNQITLTRHSIADLMYPVGSYYITESDELNTVEKMNAFFGGTWVQVTERFLYGSTSAGSTGGSADAVVVAHGHPYKAVTTLATSHTHNNFQNHQIAVAPDNVYWEGTYANGIISTGEDGTGKNMPPYRTVYMYRRTA